MNERNADAVPYINRLTPGANTPRQMGRLESVAGINENLVGQLASISNRLEVLMNRTVGFLPSEPPHDSKEVSREQPLDRINYSQKQLAFIMGQMERVLTNLETL